MTYVLFKHEIAKALDILEDPPDKVKFFTNNFWSLLTFLVFKSKIVS